MTCGSISAAAALEVDAPGVFGLAAPLGLSLGEPRWDLRALLMLVTRWAPYPALGTTRSGVAVCHVVTLWVKRGHNALLSQRNRFVIRSHTMIVGQYTGAVRARYRAGAGQPSTG